MILELGKLKIQNERIYLCGDLLRYQAEDLSVPSTEFIWRVFSESKYSILPVGITTDVMSKIPMVIFTEPVPSDEIPDDIKLIDTEINSDNPFKCIGVTMFDDDHYIIIKHPSFDVTQMQMDDTMKEIGDQLYTAMQTDPRFGKFQLGHKNAIYYKSNVAPVIYLDDKVCIMVHEPKLFDGRFQRKTEQYREPVLPFETGSDDKFSITFIHNDKPHVYNSAPGKIGKYYSVMFNYVIEKIINGGNKNE